MIMWRLILILILLMFNLSCSIGVRLKQFDYSKPQIITSNLPRSDKAADRTFFNWNDFDVEKEKLDELYPPIVDSGYGSPNYMPAETIVNALIDVSLNHSYPDSYETHQYPRGLGHLRLVNIVAKFHSFLMKRDLNPEREVLITAGSLNSLDLVARAYINPGDEVILFEPFYFDYRNFISLSGGKIVIVPLRIRTGTSGLSSNDWTFSKRELESKITSKTKLIWLNNPNNPTGKVYTLEELTHIGYLAKKYDLLILVDEAAQWYHYEPPYHIRIASLPGLFERTITLTSGGKTFSNTGWRIGWVIAPEPLLWPIGMIVSPSLSGVATPMQIAFAVGMERELVKWGTPQSHFNTVVKRARRARNLLVSILQSIGADVIVPTSGYCVVANFTHLVDQLDLEPYRDPRPGLTLYKYLLIKERIGTYPMALLYHDQNMWKSEYTLRFTNFKTEETITQLGIMLTKIFRQVDGEVKNYMVYDY